MGKARYGAFDGIEAVRETVPGSATGWKFRLKDQRITVATLDRQIANLYAHLERLLRLPEPKKNLIGYIYPKDNEDEAG